MNKTIFVVCLNACGALSFAQTNAPATTPPATTASQPTRPVKARKTAARPVQVATIPKDAVKTPEGAYRYKDPQGKSWIYRETPFGVSRVEDTPRTASAGTSVQTPFGATKTGTANGTPAAPAKASSDSTAHITAVAKGDLIYFQKPTPFGMTSWQKNKSDLTADEQKVWDREQAKGTR